MASTAVSTVGNAVMRMTTVSGSASLAVRSTSRPPTSGILRSATTTSTAELRNAASAIWPESAQTVS